MVLFLHMRNEAFGVWGATGGAAETLGSLLGGYFTNLASWHWAFLITLPTCLIVASSALFAIEESRDTDHVQRIDVIGILLAAVGFAGVVSALIEGQTFEKSDDAIGRLIYADPETLAAQFLPLPFMIHSQSGAMIPFRI